jgi:hypothetical protein
MHLSRPAVALACGTAVFAPAFPAFPAPPENNAGEEYVITKAIKPLHGTSLWLLEGRLIIQRN